MLTSGPRFRLRSSAIRAASQGVGNHSRGGSGEQLPPGERKTKAPSRGGHRPPLRGPGDGGGARRTTLAGWFLRRAASARCGAVKEGRVGAPGKGAARSRSIKARRMPAEYCVRGGRCSVPPHHHLWPRPQSQALFATFPRNARTVLQVAAQRRRGPALLIQVNHDLEALAAGSRHGIAPGTTRRASPRRQLARPARFRGSAAASAASVSPCAQAPREPLLRAALPGGVRLPGALDGAHYQVRLVGSSTSSSLTIPRQQRWRTERSPARVLRRPAHLDSLAQSLKLRPVAITPSPAASPRFGLATR